MAPIRQQDNPNKPSWDRSLPGLHPALRDLTPTEEELRQLADSAASAMLSPAEKWYNAVIGQIDQFKQEFKTAISPRRKSATSARAVRQSRLRLAGALGDAGRFDDALALITDARGRALPECAEMTARIKQIKEAVERDDDECCECARPVAVVKDERFRDKEATIELNRRFEAGNVYSYRHGKVVTIWQCCLCGHLNANDRIPARQAAVQEIRAGHDQIVAQTARAGKTITAQEWAARYESPEHSDIHLLKPESS